MMMIPIVLISRWASPVSWNEFFHSFYRRLLWADAERPRQSRSRSNRWNSCRGPQEFKSKVSRRRSCRSTVQLFSPPSHPSPPPLPNCKPDFRWR